jgi:hypothetical protein
MRLYPASGRSSAHQENDARSDQSAEQPDNPETEARASADPEVGVGFSVVEQPSSGTIPAKSFGARMKSGMQRQMGSACIRGLGRKEHPDRNRPAARPVRHRDARQPVREHPPEPSRSGGRELLLGRLRQRPMGHSARTNRARGPCGVGLAIVVMGTTHGLFWNLKRGTGTPCGRPASPGSSSWPPASAAARS